MPRLRFWRPRRTVVVERPGRVLPGGAFAFGMPSAGPVMHSPEPLPDPAPEPVSQPAPEAGSDAGPEAVAEAPAGPRVGLVFGDGTHVVLDPSDPRAGRFAALADELNR